MRSEGSYRMRRVNEAIKEVVSEAVSRGLKDPRVGFVTVTAVETSADLAHARVFVSVLGKQAEKNATMEGLRSAEPYLRNLVGDELRLRRMPTLQFVYDTSVDRGMRIQAMLRGAQVPPAADLAGAAAGSAEGMGAPSSDEGPGSAEVGTEQDDERSSEAR